MSNRLQQYFERIAYSGDVRPSLPVLQALHRAHVSSVPFENLDVQLGRSLTLDVDEAFDKIVMGRRGGWCYEQNGLFGWALTEIGFDVTRVAASVMRHERGEVSHANHLCLLVRSEDSPQRWLTDVGFGGSLWEPIQFAEGVHRQPPFTVGLRRLENGDWRFWEDLGDGTFSYDFAPEAADETAMAERCEFLQTAPDSGFVLNLVVQLRRADAHLSLRGRVLRSAAATRCETRQLESAAELVETLRSDFGLVVQDAARLWPRILARHDELFSSGRN